MGDRQSVVVLNEVTKYEDIGEPWEVPKRGDWVTDSKGKVFRIGGEVKNGRISCIGTASNGRRTKYWKDISKLKRLPDGLYKILSDSI